MPNLLSRIKSLKEQLVQEGERHAVVELCYKDEVSGLHVQLREQRESFLSEREEVKASHTAEKRELEQKLKGWLNLS
jgi:hypothetical protein